MSSTAIDLGGGAKARFVEFEGDAHAVLDLDLPSKDGHMCRHSITIEGGAWHKAFNGKIEGWRLVSADPLTITPSVLCRNCGQHGFITNGKWRPC